MEGDAGFAFRQLLLEISQQIRPDDAHDLAYVYQLQLDRGERRGSETLDALMQLERKGFFSSSKPDGLLKILESIQRQDLVELAKDRAMARGAAHLRSPNTDSGWCAQEVAEYRVAAAHVELLRSQTQKLRSYPHQSTNAKILTTILRKVTGVRELLNQALENISSSALATSMPDSGTYVYATMQLQKTMARTESSNNSLLHGGPALPRLPIPETVEPWPRADECDGSEEHVYATVLDLDMQLSLDDKETENLDPSDPTTAKEFDRKSSARKAVRHHTPRSPLPSDSGSKSDEADILLVATNPDSEPSDDVMLSIEMPGPPTASQNKQQDLLSSLVTNDNKAQTLIIKSQ